MKTPFAPKNDVAKTLGIERCCIPVRAAEIGGQSDAFTPKMGGALMPEIDKQYGTQFEEPLVQDAPA